MSAEGFLLSVFPTETAGDGRIRRQYLKQSDGQGGGRKRRRVSCRNCGFPGCDLDRHDHSGGSLDGSGAGGTVTLQSNGDGDQQGADGNQEYRFGGGCPMCFSKNFYGSGVSRDEFAAASSFLGLI